MDFSLDFKDSVWEKGTEEREGKEEVWERRSTSLEADNNHKKVFVVVLVEM
jgi:hypothetical protein